MRSRARRLLEMPLCTPASIIMMIIVAGFLLWSASHVVKSNVHGLMVIKYMYWALYNGLWSSVFCNRYFYFGAALIFLCEYIRPVNPVQKILSQAVVIDFIWSAITVLMIGTVITAYSSFLTDMFNRYVVEHLIHVKMDLPFFAKILSGYLLIDFIGWIGHLIMHKVKFFWAFHMIHHSQTQMNLFTNNRVHPIDFLISLTIRFGPIFIFEYSFEIASIYLFFYTIHQRFIHSNIHMNFGILRYIFVTPQSHRIHHSRNPHHYDNNFGVTLSIWDRLFGTQYRNHDEYPETGVPDPNFPNDPVGSPLSAGLLLNLIWRQFAYPFRLSVVPAKGDSANQVWKIESGNKIGAADPTSILTE